MKIRSASLCELCKASACRLKWEDTIETPNNLVGLGSSVPHESTADPASSAEPEPTSVYATGVGLPFRRTKATAAWTDERIAILKQGYADNLSYGQIAIKLGRVSRNAVIGKAHRMGLMGRKPSPSGPKFKEITVRPRRTKPFVPPQISAIPHLRDRRKPPEIHDANLKVVPEFSPNPISLVDLEPYNCRWPIGDGPIMFCGNWKAAGSYCPQHCRMAYRT